MRAILLFTSLLLLGACASSPTYRAYEGEIRSTMQVSMIQGAQYLRQDWLNRYVDSVRFSSIDGNPIEASSNYTSVEVPPGFHEITVYFYWDLGSARGLAPALVSYAASQENLSRTLRFNARAGEQYTVRAQPVFNEGEQDITNLSHVNFWIEDGVGNEIVSREDGSYTATN